MNAFERIVLGDWYVLEGGGMDHHLDITHGKLKPSLISYVSDEKPHRAGMIYIRWLICHLVLLLLVSRVDHQTSGSR